MKLEKIKTVFELSEDGFCIYVTADYQNTTITLETHTRQDKFWFKNSDPDVVMVMGKLITEAGEIFKKEIKELGREKKND